MSNLEKALEQRTEFIGRLEHSVDIKHALLEARQQHFTLTEVFAIIDRLNAEQHTLLRVSDVLNEVKEEH